MTPPVSGSRAGEVHPSLDELAGAQGAAPPPRASQESNTVTRAPASPSAADSPREFPTGTMDYYRKRHLDFVARNPGARPPPYYLQYGDKYVRAFKALGPEQLSPEGLAWRDRALKGLQEAMEERRKQRHSDFAKIEHNPQEFKEFAYQTHAEAYLKAGLLELPVQDLVTILRTPDLRDILDEEGLKQIVEVASKVRPNDVGAIIAATTAESLRRDVQPTVEQLEREMKARMARGWLQSGY